MSNADVDDLAAELAEFAPPEKKGGRPASEERVIAGFEEIQRFTEKHGRAPQHGEDRSLPCLNRRFPAHRPVIRAAAGFGKRDSGEMKSSSASFRAPAGGCAYFAISSLRITVDGYKVWTGSNPSRHHYGNVEIPPAKQEGRQHPDG